MNDLPERCKIYISIPITFNNPLKAFFRIRNIYCKLNLKKKLYENIYFDSDLVWWMQLMIIKGWKYVLSTIYFCIVYQKSLKRTFKMTFWTCVLVLWILKVIVPEKYWPIKYWWKWNIAFQLLVSTKENSKILEPLLFLHTNYNLCMKYMYNKRIGRKVTIKHHTSYVT